MSLKKSLFFMVLSLAPFFSSSLYAEIITQPATLSTTGYVKSCQSGFHTQYTGARVDIGPTIQGTSPTTWRAECANMLAIPTITDPIGVTCTLNIGSGYNGTGGGFVTYHCPSNSFWSNQDRPVDIVDAQIYAGNVYECLNPIYPILNETICEGVLLDDCGFDSPTFFPNSPTNYQSFCVTQNDGVTQCSYTATTTEQGANNTQAYIPTNETCDCDPNSPGAIPCGDIADNPTATPDDEGCIQAGKNFCPADPEERCHDTGTTGFTVCDANCGYIEGVFYCGDSDLPSAQACTNGDLRLECAGLLEGNCPSGFDCSGTGTGQTGNGTNNEIAACTTSDTRPECSGLPAGSFPTQQEIDLSGIEGLLAQGNKNTKDISDKLDGFDPTAEMKAVDDKIKADSAAQDNVDSSNISVVSSGETDMSNANSSAGAYFKGFVTNLLPTPNSGCNPYISNFGEGKAISIDICNEAAYFKILLAWILNIFLAMHLFNMIMVRAAPVKV